MPTHAERLGAERLDEAIDVFCDAFRAYPVMRYVVGPDGDIDVRMRQLTTFFVRRRYLRGGPLLGVLIEEQIAGAAILTLPDEPGPPPAVTHLERDVWNALGDDARERYERYALATKPFATPARHHHLNMIGVRGTYAGGGIGRLLLTAVQDLATTDADSEGVSLTTESRRNVALYEHCGYHVVGHAHVAPDLDTWGLFLTTRGR